MLIVLPLEVKQEAVELNLPELQESPPTFEAKLLPATAKEGETLVLSCTVSGLTAVFILGVS